MKVLKLFLIILVISLVVKPSQTSAGIEGRNIFTRDIYDMKTTEIGDVLYVSLADFILLINSKLSWDPISGTAKIDTGSRIIKVSMYSSYISVDNNTYNLIYRTTFENGSLYVPFITFVDLCNKVLRGELIYNEDQGYIDFVPRLFNILDLNSEEKSNGFLITLFLSEKLKYDYILTDEGWLNITLHGGRVDTEEIKKYNLKPSIRQIRAYQFENSAQLSFRLKNNKVSFTISERDDPSRITISVNTASEGGVTGIPTWRKNNIELVIIDAGHGGKDPGAVGRKYGTKEKDIVLDISKRVAKILSKNGLKVTLTRKKDVFIPLGERTNFANRLGADLFVSIHANASVKTHPRGNETFFLAQAKTDEARAVAALENSSIRFEQENNDIMEVVGDLDFILMDIVQNEYLKESSELAEMIQNEFKRKIKIPNRGVDQAGFYVLNRAYMPAVLVETAFISNKEEEKLLRSKSFRQSVAESIARGIMNFKHKYQVSSK